MSQPSQVVQWLDNPTKKPACQSRSCRRCGFDPWVKISWSRKWSPIPVFLPGESHGQRSLEGYSPRGHKELDTTEANQSILSPLLQLFIIINRGLCFATEGNGRREGTMKTGTQRSFPQAQRETHGAHHLCVQSFTENIYWVLTICQVGF